jgi:sulfite exporter TauE/SafE
VTVAGAWPFLAAALTLGLAGSVHCLGMCGGIAAAAGTQARADGRLFAAVTFNAGRLGSYVLLGAAVGAIVGAAVAQVPVRPLAIVLRAVAGLLMLAMGLSLLTGRDLLSLERLGGRAWGRIRPLAGRALSLPAPVRFAGLGLLWGFLPCGLVYSALALAAAAGSASYGAATMLAFGAGTLPAMLAVTLAGAAFSRRFAGGGSRRLAGALMIVFAAWTAFGTLAPHGGGAGAGHGGMPAGDAHPGAPHHRGPAASVDSRGPG